MDKENFSCGTDCTACGGDTQGCTDALIERAEKAETERDRLTAEVERLDNENELLRMCDTSIRDLLKMEVTRLTSELETAQKTIDFLKGTCRDDLGLSACD